MCLSLEIQTDMNQSIYTQYHQSFKTEDVTIRQQPQSTENSSTASKSEAVKSTQVNTTTSAQPYPLRHVDTVEISEEAKKLYEASLKQKEAETIKKHVEKEQVEQSAQEAKKEVKPSAEIFVTSETASQATTITRTDTDGTFIKKDENQSKVEANEKGSKSK